MLRVQGVCKASSGVQPCAATTKIVHLHIIAILSNPMSLTPEQVQQVAHLARLAVPPERLPAYAQQLSNILAMSYRESPCLYLSQIIAFSSGV